VVNRTVQDIKTALDELAGRWLAYEGTERSASQTFLNQLLAAYTGNTDVMDAGARFEEFGARDEGSGFMDLYWRDVVIIEMKAPSQSRRLDQHRAQALDYWRNSANSEKGIAAPPYLVLCSIRQFEIWEPGRYPNAPVDSFSLADLPDRVESLLFLAGKKPIFGGPGAAVTEKAAEHMVELYFSLLERRAVPPEELRRFVVQTVWTLFAEDLGLIEGKPLETLIRSLLADQSRSTAVELADLYRRFNIKDDERRNRGRQQGLPYVNGDLFAVTTEVHLGADELEHLLAASVFDWRYVDPTVFGSLLEGCLGHNHRWELGAHYTSEVDIMTIVEPVIVRPWVSRIEGTKSLKEAMKLHDELCKFKVLDPAMGCGNFLSIAYRELRKLELRLHDRMGEHARKEGGQPRIDMQWFPINNIQGIEIDPFAVDIAKTTLWMTHALESRRHGLAEPVLPLPSLTSLVCADSLKTDWPTTDAVIGNPPFHGDRNLRKVVGDEYIDWLKQEFGVGVKDHCVYFFIKADRELKPEQRAGFVATNTISQAKNRDAALASIVTNGSTITEAISSKPWSGEAKVFVSIVCWQKNPTDTDVFILDGKQVSGITPSLTEGSVHRVATKLMGNRATCFVGFLPNGMGFVLEHREMESLISQKDANYADVVFRFMNGEDLVQTTHQEPTRWIIDFGNRTLEEAARYPAALHIVRERVKPIRDKANRKAHRERWWQFAETRPGIMQALPQINRTALVCLTGKRLLLTWAEPNWRPSHACGVFVFEDDYNFGVCSSQIHEIWARANGSTLKGDLRYTPSTVFDTFPFPRPSIAQHKKIGTTAEKIVALRRSACDSIGAGLTKVYNLMDEGGFVELKAAHRELDLAVADAYGWNATMLDDPARLLDALFDLNEKCAQDSNYKPFPNISSSPSLLDLSEDDQ
jgi:hypothetical protein